MTMQARPWYENYGLDVLAEMVKRDPSYADMLPPQVWDAFSHDFIAQNPRFIGRLTGENYKTFIRNNPQFIDPKTGAIIPNPAPSAVGGVPVGTGDTRSAEAGDKTGMLERTGPTGVSLREGTQTTPLPPGLASPITGAPTPSYQSQGGVPIFSNQSIARLMPGERELLGTTVNRAGGRAQDYFQAGRQLTGGSRTRGTAYGGAPRYSRR